MKKKSVKVRIQVCEGISLTEKANFVLVNICMLLLYKCSKTAPLLLPALFTHSAIWKVVHCRMDCDLDFHYS